MPDPDVRLIGALDDIHGRTVAIYQDHDGVRIDVGGIEIMLDLAGADRARKIINDATYAARAWRYVHEHQAGTGV